jgi:hypothetical protein
MRNVKIGMVDDGRGIEESGTVHALLRMSAIEQNDLISNVRFASKADVAAGRRNARESGRHAHDIAQPLSANRRHHFRHLATQDVLSFCTS